LVGSDINGNNTKMNFNDEPGLLRCTQLYRVELTSHAFFKV